MTSKLCLIEDDPIMGESLCDRFALEGFQFDWHRSGRTALESIGCEPYGAVISDIRLPDFSGEDLFRALRARDQQVPPFIFITAYGTVDRAVEMLKLGAADYITKPFDIELLIAKLQLCAQLPVQTRSITGQSPVLGVSTPMRRIEELLPRIAAYADTVLITGESGVGKERVAQLLHRLGDPEGATPFIAVNCAALSESLLEAELFGHEKGAFTGAFRTKRGVFEQAEGGTLFLDEIGDMPLAMQAKLLRAIQEREVMRVGGERRIPVQLRLVGATNGDLRTLVDAGRFREDLFYRVNVINLRVPPLRARQDDILWLARVFLAEHARLRPGEAKKLSVAAEAALVSHAWPGNIRELQHSIARACIFARHTMLEPRDLFEDRLALPDAETISEAGTLIEFLQRCEREYLVRALKGHGWQISETATALGISRKNLWERMRRLHISESAGGDGP
jgi:DNA-binding NtrC family response regulator